MLEQLNLEVTRTESLKYYHLEKKNRNDTEKVLLCN